MVQRLQGARDVHATPVEYSHDGQYIATIDDSVTGFDLWDAAKGALVHLPFSGDYFAFAFSPDGKYLVGSVGRGVFKV